MGARVGPAGTRRTKSLVVTALVLALVLTLTLLAAGCGEGDEGTTDGNSAEPTETPLTLPISNDACLSCHSDFDEVTAGEDPKEFSHSLHTAQRIDCSTCHSDAAHAGGPKPPSQEVCDDCHGIEMPHPEDFGVSHGKLVNEQGDDVCEQCHNVYLHCQVCHGLQMPHPAEWEQKHGEIAYPQMQTCDTCHDKNFCLQCHPVEMPHPQEWTRTHGFSTVAQGSEKCVTCHEPELCTACHGMPMPHPADWGTEHPAMAQEKRGECLLCHVEEDCAACHEIHDSHVSGGGGS